MTNQFTAKTLARMCALLDAEYLAGEKARLYSNTMTDMALSAKLKVVAQNHTARYCALLNALLAE